MSVVNARDTMHEDGKSGKEAECRTTIDCDAPHDKHENLLAMTQTLAGVRYNDPRFFQTLGGREAMFESPMGE
jgi:hypothetical protein